MSQTPPPVPPLPRNERLLESVLWNSRLVFGFATLSCLVLAIGLLWISTLDAAHMVQLCLHYGDPTLETAVRKGIRVEIVGEAVKSLDGFLLAMAMLIFAFGIYELFVSDLNEAHSHQLAGKILVIRSLDDLKSRLGKVILVIMVVTLFEGVLEFHASSALDLLAVAGAIVLAAAALYLSHREH
jgi:uncharacterized membrane protein YqhA